jgi:hypothetical protein
MAISRNQFFLFLLCLAILIFIVPKIIWIAKAEKTTGRMWYTGHGNLGSALGVSTYSVIRYHANGDSLFFNSNLDLGLLPDEKVSVLFQKNKPSDAMVNSFVSIWAETLIYLLFPVLILCVLFFTPERLQPIIPKKSKIIFGGRTFIRIVQA